MKFFLVFLLISTLLFSFEQEVEETAGVIEVKDTSGLSDNAVRAKAKKKDAQDSKKVSIAAIVNVANTDGTVDIKKLQALWEEQSPTPNGHDWIQSKSGEWFKGRIKAMFNDKLDFDSSEVGLYEFDFENISQIKSYNLISVNIDGLALFTGVIRVKDDKITIIQGDDEFTFLTSQIISFAHEGDSDFDNLSGKGSINFNHQEGNTNQSDFTARLKLQRRTAETRLSLEYTGNISYADGIETKNNHRISESFDIFLSRRLYWTPLFSEYYRNEYQNIHTQITSSIALGYRFIDEKNIRWEISSGPGVIYTEYDSLYAGRKNNRIAPTLVTRTDLEFDITNDIAFLWDYQFLFTEKKSGKYRHHMVTSLELDLTQWLSVNLSYVWDHLEVPEKDANGDTPYRDDHQTMMGIGIDF